MTTWGVCEKCGEPVAEGQVPAFPVKGWEVGRSGGGANAIRLREREPNRVRHAATCLPMPHDDQPALFGGVAA